MPRSSSRARWVGVGWVHRCAYVCINMCLCRPSSASRLRRPTDTYTLTPTHPHTHTHKNTVMKLLDATAQRTGPGGFDIVVHANDWTFPTDFDEKRTPQYVHKIYRAVLATPARSGNSTVGTRVFAVNLNDSATPREHHRSSWVDYFHTEDAHSPIF